MQTDVSAPQTGPAGQKDPARESTGLTAGIDEVGRGCLAGPVVACAVIVPANTQLPSGLDDSKRLTSKQRERLTPQIKNIATAWGLGLVWPRDIDASDILRASLRAMAVAVSFACNKLDTGLPDQLLIDGNQCLPQWILTQYAPRALTVPQQAIIKGDGKIPAISAASVLAKTFRDSLMQKLDTRYPGYHFAQHKGYGTQKHLVAIEKQGPCPLHRMSFAPLRQGKQARQQQKTQEQQWLPGTKNPNT